MSKRNSRYVDLFEVVVVPHELRIYRCLFENRQTIFQLASMCLNATSKCVPSSWIVNVSSFYWELQIIQHVIRRGKPRIVETAAKFIRQLQDPTRQTYVPSLLWLSSVCHRFVPNFRRSDAPLSRKLYKDQLKSFPPLTSQHKQAREPFTDVLTNPPVLELPRQTSTYIVDNRSWDKKVTASFYKRYPTYPPAQLNDGQKLWMTSKENWQLHTASALLSYSQYCYYAYIIRAHTSPPKQTTKHSIGW